MSNEKEHKRLVPELRFTEFVEEWNINSLNDVSTLRAGKFVKASDINEQNVKGLYPCYGGNGLRGYTETFTHEGDYSLIGRQGALCGNVVFVKDKFHATEHAVVTTPKKDIHNKWLYYVLIRANLNQYATGQAQPGLSVANLEKVEITVPRNIKEQQKIANTLTSLDNLIAAENEKLEALQAHKKGLLQQLFPAKGEKVPKLRFGEFEGEWLKKTLGDIGKPLMCKRIFKQQTTTDSNNTIPFYKIGTFGKEADAYISNEIFREYKSKFSYPKVGDILLSASGTIGRLVVYDGEDAYYQDSNIVWLGHNEEEINNSFLYYHYSTVNWQTSDGGVIKRLYNSNLKETEILFPKEKKEQQKIANCLSSFDDKIDVQSLRIESLKEHKKGLMQQMFPNLNSRRR